MFQCEKNRREVNPKKNANLFSLVTFFFVRDVFCKSLKKELEEDDVYEVLNNCNAKKLGDRLEAIWEKDESKKKKPNLFTPLIRIFGVEYLKIGLHQLILKTVIISVQPILVGKFVGFFSPGQKDITLMEAYLYGGSLLISYLLRCIYSHNCMFYILQLGIKIRVATSSLLYRKTLKLNQIKLMEMSSGKIATLISKDVFSFDAALMFGHDIWIGVIQVTIMTYLMYNAIGISAFVGVAFMIAIVPLQLFIGKVISMMRKKCAAKTDERLRLIQEILTTIRIIKMYTWERFYADKTNAERKAEIKKLRLIYYLKGLILTLGGVCTRVSFYLSVLLYTYLYDNNVTAEKIFTVLSCYAALRSVLSICIPIGISQIAEFKASLDRINKLLREPVLMLHELEELNQLMPSLNLNNVTVTIKKKSIINTLNLSLQRGLVALTGPLGAGKSTLLKTILKDLEVAHGDVNVQGKMSYASQEPWLFPGSIKQNILFGQNYDEDRYKKVINLCALRSDLNCFPKGDETILIDKGLNLSRGQQARVNLARAIYKKADIYLLDDALSSLDTNVSRFIFNNCIKEYLRKKLCLIVTHQQQYLKEVDQILYLKDGQILINGTYEDVLNSAYGTELLLNKIDFNNDDYDDKTDQQEMKETNDLIDENEFNESTQLLDKKNVYMEKKKIGRVDPKMYGIYLNSGSGVTYKIYLVFIFIFSTIFSIFFDFYVKRWVNLEELRRNLTITGMRNTSEYEKVNFEHDLVPYIYTILITSAIVFSLLQFISFFYFTSSASIVLHKKIFNNMLKAKMDFFDTHLSGNILNRFAKDISLIDEFMPFIYYEVIRVLLMLLGILFLIISTYYLFLLYSVIMGIILLVMRHYYLPASRSLKRLELASKSLDIVRKNDKNLSQRRLYSNLANLKLVFSLKKNTRAPMLGHINASLEGLTTIRANNAQDILIKQFDVHQDLNSSATYMFMMSSRAFGFYLDVICVFYVIAIILTFLLSYPNVLAGNVGLAITQALGLAGLLQWGIRQSTEIENCMTAVERTYEYSKTEPETDGGSTILDWPNRGKLEFRNVTLKYSSNPKSVLNNLNFVIEPNQKVGIIGRTGAGKSSIISTLFRLYEISGQIIIDEQDIKTINLKHLRSNLSIIPQDPILFNGTIRTNLDPNLQYSDEKIWQALETVQIKQLINDLNDTIEEGGSNFSIGQRQLICLARAILKQNKILILDEATANIDPKTDSLIQKTIREKFVNCTILTIAHRLDTILDSDKILVLDDGNVIEFDSARNLLQNKKSKFFNMAKQARLI